MWYRGQPLQCLMCREIGHRAQSCPLSGQYRYCHQVGHMARDCARAWDPPPSVPVDDADIDVSSVSDSATVIEDPEPADKPTDPEPSAAIVEDDCVPETVPVNNSSDPEPPFDLPLDKLPDPEPVIATDNPPVPPTTDKPPDDDVSMPRPARSSVTAKVFCACL